MRAVLQNLKPGTNYEFQLKALGGSNQSSDWSPKFKLTTAQYNIPPQVPTQVTWDVDGSSFVGTWTAVTLDTQNQPVNIVAYDIQLTPVSNPSLFSTVTVPFGDDTITYVLPYEDNLALFGTVQGALKFKVRSVDVRGTRSGWSDELTAQNAAPAAPTNAHAVGMSDAIAFDWTASTSDDTAGYRIYTGADSSFTPSVSNKIYQGEATTFTYGTSTYSPQFFKLCTYDEFGIESTYVSLTAQPSSPFALDVTPPPVPDINEVVIVNNTNGIGAMANIDWSSSPSMPSDLGGFYVRWRRTGSTDIWMQTTFDQDVREGSVGLEYAYTDYDFQVKAFDFIANASAWTSVFHANGDSGSTPPKVVGASFIAGRETVSISWTPVNILDLRGYEVLLATNFAFTTGLVTYQVGTSTNLSLTGLTPNTPYWFKIRAVNRAGTVGPYSDILTTITDAELTAADIGATDTTYVNNLLNRKITHSTSAPTNPATGYSTNDIWIRYNGLDQIIGQWRVTGGNWVSEKIEAQFIASVDAGVITANSTFTNNLTVQSVFTLGKTGFLPGVIQSYDYDGTHGFRLSSNGLVINEGSIIVNTLKGGTIGGTSGAGVINIGTGTNMLFSGGYLKSTTYTGTSQTTNPSGVGFYLGNDGLRVDDGIISAKALTTGTISGVNTITLSGSNAKIVGDYFSLSGTGLTITNGVIEAAALNLQNSQNIIPPQYADFEFSPAFYSGAVVNVGGMIHNVGSTNGKFGPGRYGAIWAGNSGTVSLYMGTSTTDYNIQLEELTDYIFSTYAWADATIPLKLGVKWSNGSEVQVDLQNITGTTAATAQRLQGKLTVPSGVTGGLVFVSSTAATGGFSIDGMQVELKIAGKNTASPWKPSFKTTINGGGITTGSIQSQATSTISGVSGAQPLWSIDTQGLATFNGARIRGNTIVGNAAGSGGAEAGSWIQSADYLLGTRGWQIKSDGNAYFMNVEVKGTIKSGSVIQGADIQATNTITGATFKTDSRVNRGLLIDGTGIKAYTSASTSGTPVVSFSINNETGALTLSGNLDASSGTITGANIIGTSNISGASIAGGTVTGALIQTNVSGNRAYMVANNPALFFDTNSGTGYIAGNDTAGLELRGPGGIGQIYIQANGTVGVNGNLTVPGAIYSPNGMAVGNSIYGPNMAATNGDFGGNVTTQFLYVLGGYLQNNIGPAYFNNQNRIVKGDPTSSRKYKKEIKPLEKTVGYDSIIGLEPVTFKYKGAAREDWGTNVFSGFIAEQADELGLSQWVNYDEDGQPDSFKYSAFLPAVQMVIREQDKRIKELSARMEQYESLEQRLADLESRA